ncbi:MAG: hypothetical protein ACRDZX_13625 [Acidimicrobiales bacterium]
MPTYQLLHRHEPDECRFAYAAWNGFDSPLRHHGALSSCAQGGHRICWTVEAGRAEAALRLLPPFLAVRCEVDPVSEVPIP